MTVNQRKLEERRKRLVKRLTKCDPWVGGSISEIKRICSSKGCRCKSGGPKHPAMYLVWKENQKTRGLYVPRLLENEVRKWSENYRKAKEIMHKITEIQRQIITLR